MTLATTLPAPPRRWIRRGRAEDDPDAAAELACALRLPEPLCRLLVRRGHGGEAAAKRFLKPRLERLHDPFGMAGMEQAVVRLERALDAGETILVHGDYDVDGVCTAALYTRVLRQLGGNVKPFVPHRSDGYDLGPAGVSAAVDAGASLVLTGDCAIVAHEAVVAAGEAGLDVIVTDHHTPGETLPPAVAVVNPSRADCPYPDERLAGTGIAFKVCRALFKARGRDPERLRRYLDLVGLATVADMVPLVGENRVLARYGLRLLPETKNPGLRALLHTTGLAGQRRITAGQASFVLAPRINAVGRIGAAMRAVWLLLTDREAEACALAERMEEQNRERRTVDRGILREAFERLERDFDPARDYGVVLAGAGWHPGVIGIVASRVAERIHRPTVMLALSENGGPARGSARSIPAFHLYEAVRACGEHLERFGGHRQAAGLDIRPENIEAFREQFNAHARAALSPEDFVAEVETDLDVRLGQADEEFYRYLRHFGPFGVDNPAPVLRASGVTCARRPRTVGNGHLKLTLAQGDARLEAIGFGMAEKLEELDVAGSPLDVAFELQENHWRGRVSLQAKLVALRAAR